MLIEIPKPTDDPETFKRRVCQVLAMISGAGTGGSVTLVTAIQAGGAGAKGIQYKSRSITFSGGIAIAIGAESGWTDI